MRAAAELLGDAHSRFSRLSRVSGAGRGAGAAGPGKVSPRGGGVRGGRREPRLGSAPGLGRCASASGERAGPGSRGSRGSRGADLVLLPRLGAWEMLVSSPRALDHCLPGKPELTPERCWVAKVNLPESRACADKTVAQPPSATGVAAARLRLVVRARSNLQLRVRHCQSRTFSDALFEQRGDWSCVCLSRGLSRVPTEECF